MTRPATRRTQRLLAALAAAAVLAMPERAHALTTEWANVQNYESPYYVNVDILIVNNNQGTEYTSVTLSSLVPLFEALYAANRAYYPSVGAMVNGGWEVGNPNVIVAVNSSPALVNSGWNTAFNADGSLTSYRQAGNPFADKFTYGLQFAGTVQVNKALFGPGGTLSLAPNARQAADSFVNQSGYTGYGIPAQIPWYEPAVTGLVVRAVAASARGATNLVTFSVDTAGRQQFRVQGSDSLSATNWCDLRVCVSTGAVTEVCETNTVPARFYRVVSP